MQWKEEATISYECEHGAAGPAAGRIRSHKANAVWLGCWPVAPLVRRDLPVTPITRTFPTHTARRARLGAALQSLRKGRALWGRDGTPLIR